MSLKDTLSTYWLRLQGELLPWLDDTMGGPLSGHHKQLVSVLGLLRIETLLPSGHGLIGRPSCQRAALARAFIAKAVFNLPTTTVLIDILRVASRTGGAVSCRHPKCRSARSWLAG